VAATNISLEEAMRKKEFRRDLYYRLAVVTVDLPPLRERKSDITALAHHFMQKYSAIYNKKLTGIAPAALQIIMKNPWPGNIRELENVMERSVLLSSGTVIDETSLPLSVRHASAGVKTCLESLKSATRAAGRKTEEKSILAALSESNGNKTKAAKILGISRSSLYNKIKELGIEKS
jgi:two-component system NtrC family response regulator